MGAGAPASTMTDWASTICCSIWAAVWCEKGCGWVIVWLATVCPSAAIALIRSLYRCAWLPTTEKVARMSYLRSSASICGV